MSYKPKQMVLKRLRHHWPSVQTVVDATKPVVINVILADATDGRPNNPGGCALARACVREGVADAALIGPGTSFLLHGTRAVRYKTPVTTAREIVTFDRHADFAPGKDYHLAPISPTARFGAAQREGRAAGARDGSRPGPVALHHTVRVRSPV